MPRRIVDLGGQPLLDIASYGRSVSRPLTPNQRRQIMLTVRRAPEVMVKVSGGARTLRGIQAHFSYIGREGELGVEMDDGRHFVGRAFEKRIVPDWDLDLWAHRRQDARSIRGTRRPSKLVHNIIFSMPPGTPADKVLKAVRGFAVNQFALKHRYAMVLHTDGSHPHVHLVVKAVSEQGERLNIRKETLRNWRQQFATHLRELGIAANATERAVRGQNLTPKPNPIYRAVRRNESTYERNEVIALASNDGAMLLRHRNGKEKIEQTRSGVIAGWYAVAQRLHEERKYTLADEVRSFAASMAPSVTDQQYLARKVLSQTRARKRINIPGLADGQSKARPDSRDAYSFAR